MIQSGGLKAGMRSDLYHAHVFRWRGDGLLETLNNRGTTKALAASAAAADREIVSRGPSCRGKAKCVMKSSVAPHRRPSSSSRPQGRVRQGRSTKDRSTLTISAFTLAARCGRRLDELRGAFCSTVPAAPPFPPSVAPFADSPPLCGRGKVAIPIGADDGRGNR
jgi:hypothetical protein